MMSGSEAMSAVGWAGVSHLYIYMAMTAIDRDYAGWCSRLRTMYGKRHCSKFGPADSLPRFAILYFKIQNVSSLFAIKYDISHAPRHPHDSY